MDKKWILLCIIFALLFLAGCLLYIRYFHHKRAKAKVRRRSNERKLQEINTALRPFGFAYDLEKDIFYSLEDAWQRKTGYGKLYDEMAPVMNMVIDCEPIYFTHERRRWLIELWKGQYGITTGAEIGIYVEKERGEEKRGEEGRKEAGWEVEADNEVFYQAVSDEEEMYLTMALYRNGELLFRRQERHWWLTGFCLGKFSKPRDLVLRAVIHFPSQKMMKAFLEGCYQAGYRTEDLYVKYNDVILNFTRPKTVQPMLIGTIHRRFVQLQNRWSCKLYLHLTKSFASNLDRLYYLMMEYPILFEMITKVGRIGRIPDKAEQKIEKRRRMAEKRERAAEGLRR